MNVLRFTVPIALAGILSAGCGSGGNDLSPLESAPAAVEITTTTAPTVTTMAAPTTTTTMAPTTTTTAAAPTTTRPPVTTTTTILTVATAPVAAPSCTLRALASPVVADSTQTLYLTSNLPGMLARIGGKQVMTDADGAARVTIPVVGRSRIENVDAVFYTEPWTLDDFMDFNMPPELTSCSTSYQVFGS